MYVCNYCNRHLKEEYEVCPGCGATSFKTKSFLGEIVISDPPKDGYKLNVSNFETSEKVKGEDKGNGTWYYRVNVSDHNGEAKEIMVGLMPKSTIVSNIQKHI